MAHKGPQSRDEILARVRAHPLEGSPDDMRAAFRMLVLGSAAGTDTGARSIRPKAGSADLPPVVWFHGGGYVFGGPDTHVSIARYLSDRHGFTVHLPHVPLAPEHRWPTQLKAAMAAIPKGRAPILAGDSAGGHLALVTALAMAREGRPVAGLLLCSPNTDRTGLSRTREEMDEDDPMVDDKGDRELAQLCFGGRSWSDVTVSPLLDDLSLLPPTWIEVGSNEVLLDDSRLLAARAKEASAEVHLTVTPDLLHMAQIWAPDWEEAAASLDRLAAFATDIAERQEMPES